MLRRATGCVCSLHMKNLETDQTPKPDCFDRVQQGLCCQPSVCCLVRIGATHCALFKVVNATFVGAKILENCTTIQAPWLVNDSLHGHLYLCSTWWQHHALYSCQTVASVTIAQHSNIWFLQVPDQTAVEHFDGAPVNSQRQHRKSAWVA